MWTARVSRKRSICHRSHTIKYSMVNTSTRWLTRQISGKIKAHFCQTPKRATGKYTQDNNLHLPLSFFIATYSASSFFPFYASVSPHSPFTSLCVVVATPWPPDYNARVFVSGVVALPPLFSPFFLSLCTFEIWEWKKRWLTDGGEEEGDKKKEKTMR